MPFTHGGGVRSLHLFAGVRWRLGLRRVLWRRGINLHSGVRLCLSCRLLLLLLRFGNFLPLRLHLGLLLLELPGCLFRLRLGRFGAHLGLLVLLLLLGLLLGTALLLSLNF